MKNNFLKKLTDKNIFWLIVSLITALVFWAYVTSVESDVYTQTFRNIPVSIIGEENLRDKKNLVITDVSTNAVSVEITGPRRIVSALKSSELTAEIDVSKMTQSVYSSLTYNIVFPERTDTSSISVNAKFPETINFMVSKETSKTIAVKGSFNGKTAEGFSAEMPVFEPSTITVYGPEAYLKSVSYAWITFGSETVNSTYSEEAGFTLMDEDGKECSNVGLTFSSDTILATLPILMVKEVPLEVSLIEGAGATAANTKIKITPASVKLAGDSAILSGLNKITLATIDLKDFKSTLIENYNIIYDDDLKNLTGVTEAKVEIEIVGLQTKTYKITNLSYINVTEGYSCDILTESLEVIVRGQPETLEQIGPENIRAVADLDDYKESVGIYRPLVKIYIDGFNGVGVINNTEITIELRKNEGTA